MASNEKDEVLMLSNVHPRLFDENLDSRFQAIVSRTRSASISIPMSSMEESYENEPNLLGYTGPLRSERRAPLVHMSGPIYSNRKKDSIFRKNHRVVEPKAEKFPSFNGMDQHDCRDDKYAAKNEHLMRSGQLGLCDDPYCTTCPTYYKFRPSDHRNARTSSIFDSKFHNALYGDAKGWVTRFMSLLSPYIPGVMNPHTRVVQHWNKFFVIACLVAIFVDLLFFFLLSVRRFRLAYIAPVSRVVGAGELVGHPKKIALHYLFGYFAMDLFIILPLPQIIILMIVPEGLGTSGANYAKNLLRVAVLVQYIPRLYRFLPRLVGVSPTGFIFETAWANFFINLLTFMLSGHVVGSCWYLLGLQRVNQCFRDACHKSDIWDDLCMDFIDCGYGNDFARFGSNPNWTKWKNNENATACFTEDGFSYGIYAQAVNLTTKYSIVTRYLYSLFWGFQVTGSSCGISHQHFCQ